MQKKKKVTLTLNKEMMNFLDTLPRIQLRSKSELIDKLLVDYSSSMSGSQAIINN